MRVTRRPNRYLIRCTQHEYEILVQAAQSVDYNSLSTGHRRSWARRTQGGHFLRIDRYHASDSHLKLDLENNE